MKQTTNKRLTRPVQGRVFTGLLAGVAEYLDTDPVVVRLIFILATAFTGFGPGLVAYIIGSLVVPNKE